MSCIGIISALSSEGRCLSGKPLPVNKPVQINQHALAIVCGMGADNVQAAAQLLLDQKVSALVSWGTAGALTENIYSGDLILADSVVNTAGDKITFDTEWNKRVANKLCHAPLKIHHGTIAHTDQIMTTAESKTSLHTTTHALATDMESFTIAQYADKTSLPCLSVRTIVDEAMQTIPEEILGNTDKFGRPALLQIFACLLRKPGLINNLIQLSQGMKAATKSLMTVADNQALY